MIIHLIGSMRHFDEDFTAIRTIADMILDHGDSIALNWFDAVKSRKDRNTTREDDLDWPTLVAENLRALKAADALIIEGSRFNYSQAFQTAIALSNNKPILNLYRKDLPEYTEWPDKLFVSGIDSPLFHNISYYSTNDLPKIVEHFLDEISPKTAELEIKMNLDTELIQQLQQIAEQQNMTINGVVKDLILQNTK